MCFFLTNVILIISLNLRRQLSHVASLLFCDCALPVALHLIPIGQAALFFSGFETVLFEWGWAGSARENCLEWVIYNCCSNNSNNNDKRKRQKMIISP